jgi:hypothetical protein
MAPQSGGQGKEKALLQKKVVLPWLSRKGCGVVLAERAGSRQVEAEKALHKLESLL